MRCVLDTNVVVSALLSPGSKARVAVDRAQVIRMALGADRQNVLVLVLKQGITLTLSGVLFGTVFGLSAVRFMKSLLYGVTIANPESYVGLVAVVSFVARCSPCAASSIDRSGSFAVHRLAPSKGKLYVD